MLSPAFTGSRPLVRTTIVLAPCRPPFSSLVKDGAGSSSSPSPFPEKIASSAAGRDNSSSNPGKFSASAFFGLRPLLISAIDQLPFPSLVLA
jgi:hypothetical protein